MSPGKSRYVGRDICHLAGRHMSTPTCVAPRVRYVILSVRTQAFAYTHTQCALPDAGGPTTTAQTTPGPRATHSALDPLRSRPSRRRRATTGNAAPMHGRASAHASPSLRSLLRAARCRSRAAARGFREARPFWKPCESSCAMIAHYASGRARAEALCRAQWRGRTWRRRVGRDVARARVRGDARSPGGAPRPRAPPPRRSARGTRRAA